MDDLDDLELPPSAVRLIAKAIRAAFRKGQRSVEARFDRMLGAHLREKQLHELNGTTEVFKHAWQESKHKRDHGKFAPKEGGKSDGDVGTTQAAEGVRETGSVSSSAGNLTAIPESHLLDGLHADVPAGLWSQVKSKVKTAAQRVHERLVLATPTLLKFQDLLTFVGDHPDDLKRFGYKPVTSGVAGHDTPDALRDATGIGGTLGARLAAHVLARVVSWIRTQGAVGKAADDSDPYAELGSALADVLAILAEEFGGEAPDAAAVAAALRAMEDERVESVVKSKDASGHEHRGKGPGGGQFTSGGEGDGESKSGSSDNTAVDSASVRREPQQSSESKKRFGKSKADVNYVKSTPSQRSEIDQVFRDALGTDDVEQIASVVGAPDDAVVTIDWAWKAGYEGKKAKITVTHESFTAVRYVYKNKAGETFIHNSEFWVNEDSRGNGLGAEMFGKQVETAAELGVAAIVCHAAKENPNDEDKPHNGYYTWPRFGYDMSLTDEAGIHESDKEIFEACRKRFPDAKTILDVMSTLEGRQWWKENGTDLLKARFDLTPGSRSMQALEAYLEEREKQKKAKGESKKSTSPQSKSLPLMRPGQNSVRVRKSKDASGHEHRGKGPGGGQFTSGGEGDGTDSDIDKLKSDAHNPGMKTPSNDTVSDKVREQVVRDVVGKDYPDAKEMSLAQLASEFDLSEWKSEIDAGVAIRTPAFKEWFGDWESNPSGSSKVVDSETGQPLVVYHGTESEFDKFAVQKEQRAGDPMSKIGVMFTASKDIAKRYGTREIQTYLDIRKPLHLSVTDVMEWDDDNGGIRYTMTADELRDLMHNRGADGIIFRSSTQREDEELGLDGEWDSPQYVVLSPNQIKIVGDSRREPVAKAWNPDEHPRGDDGRFIDAHDLHDARSDPAKAAELRNRVTKPEERRKLDEAIGAEPSPATDQPSAPVPKVPSPTAERAAAAREMDEQGAADLAQWRASRQRALNLSDPAAVSAAVRSVAAGLPAWNGDAYDPSTPYPHKVYLSHVYDALKPQLPPGTTLDDFKAALSAHGTAGHVRLSPIDMPQFSRDAAAHAASETRGDLRAVEVSPEPTAPAAVPARRLSRGKSKNETPTAKASRLLVPPAGATPDVADAFARIRAPFDGDAAGDYTTDRQVAGRVASAWLQHHAAGNGAVAAALEPVLAGLGVERHGDLGATVPFDGRVHESKDGVSTGAPVRVVRHGWLVKGDPGPPIVRTLVERV